MLELRNIQKDYHVGEQTVHALKGVSLAFRRTEFVSILGQSGCGKTTLLNIIGGLDGYSRGDLIIDGRSTKYFKPSDWDAYRNNSIGFVFQSYNLIPHLTVLGNVELALTLSGVSKAERTRRAAAALEKVGLGNQLKKKPNQMSGGQMQRVAIARAIVNDPEIILADEPTGALDNETGIQVMELLKEISKDRLVIMVTHNANLAREYSTRIISMLDGRVEGDTEPLEGDELTALGGGKVDENSELFTLNDKAVEQTDFSISDGTSKVEADEKAKAKAEKERRKQLLRRQKEITKANKASMRHTSMSFFTALGLSWKNMITKKGRTIATSVAGSIGIIGVALVLALSNGFTVYVNDMETQMLSSYPVSVSQVTLDMDATINTAGSGPKVELENFPDGKKLYIKTENTLLSYHYNKITQDFLDYVQSDEMKKYAVDVTYSYAMDKIILSDNVLDDNGDKTYNIVDMDSGSSLLSNGTVQPLLNNTDYVLSQYDIWGKYPSESNEVAVVVGKDNSINLSTLNSIGLQAPANLDDATFDDLIGQTLKLVHADEAYAKNEMNGIYKKIDFSAMTVDERKTLFENKNNTTLTVVGVMRIKESSAMALYSSGLVYSPKLDSELIASAKNSAVAKAIKDNPTKCMVNDIYISGSPVNGIGGISYEKLCGIINKMMTNGVEFAESDIYEFALQTVGASDIPTKISFYPQNFNTKTGMKNYLDAYNDGKADADKIVTLDAVETVTSAVKQMIDIMMYVLVAFAAISLVVSSVMISIITYASVAERTKEIGVLRAVGARKKDIMRVFNAETIIIGFAAGLIGVLFTVIVSFPLSALFIAISDGMVATNLVSLSWWHAIALMLISMALTFIAGMLPARSASKKDPVLALRSE